MDAASLGLASAIVRNAGLPINSRTLIREIARIIAVLNNYFFRLKSWMNAKLIRLTATTSKMAISVLSVLILLLILSIAISSSVRFFCWRHPGILIVVFAVAGEVMCDWNRKKSIKERLKRFFGMLLVVGLILEIGEAIGEDRHVATAEIDSGYAKERAALTESNNVVLQSNVVTVAAQVLGLSEQQTQISNNIAAVQDLIKIPEIAEKLSETKKSLAEANETITEAKNLLKNPALANLKTVTPDRALTSMQKQTLISILKPFSETHLMDIKRVNIHSMLGDNEAEQYANEINDVFKECDIDCGVTVDMALFKGEKPQGVQIRFPGRPSPFAQLVAYAFAGARITYAAVAPEGDSTGPVEIWIYEKPDN